MPIYQEATFHDRQSVSSTVSSSTSSTTHVDLPGATLTTKQLGQPGNYLLLLSLLVSSTSNNTIANFRLVVNGVAPNPAGSDIILRVKDLDVGYALHLTAPDVSDQAVLKVQYKTDIGTITVSEYHTSIDGVPCSRVVI